MSRTPSYRSLLAASAVVSIAVGLFACGDGTFQNELPIYDAAFGDVDASNLNPEDSAPPATDAADAAPAIDAGDAAPLHDGGGDGGDGGHHDGGDASSDAHLDGD